MHRYEPTSSSPRGSPLEKRKREQDIDEASAQSFPASDPPSSTAVHAGPPSRLERAVAGKAATDREAGALWIDEERAYSVLTWHDAMALPKRGGLSHTQAMKLAEELRREGQVVSVMHVVGNRTYEVDRYPCR
jgi:hypothetical protein